MHLIADYHTHTTFSHGKGSIEENVLSAIKLGLKEIAITDHCYNHKFIGIKKKDFKLMRDEVDRLKEKYKNINILLGVEANLISIDGDIDLEEKYLNYLDFVIVGFHKTAIPKNFNSFVKLYIPNWLGIKTDKQISLNTNAYLKMIEKYPFLTCINHLNYACKVNAIEIAKKCIENNIFIELNGKRTLFSTKEISKMITLNTKFIINSDAHCPKNIGNIYRPMNVVIKNNIPISLIENMNNTINLKNLTKGK